MKLGIYSAEAPNSPSTWSGTPANLISGMETLGVEMDYFSLACDLAPGQAARLLGRISPASALYSKVGSKHRAHRLIDHFEKTGCDFILHAPADHLPYHGCQLKSRHVALIDATFKQFFYPWFQERYQKRSRWVRMISKFEMARRDNFYKNSLKSLSHLFVTSSWTKDSLICDYGVPGEKITVCYTGTGNIRALEEKLPRQRQRILFVARHNYLAKGAKLLLDAFRLIRSKNPETELIIVGPNPKDLGTDENEKQVRVHGFLPWEELELLFNQCTLFVMPSLYEPYGLVYLEALKCGVPVVCSTSGGMASIVKEQGCGWVLDTLEAKPLAELLDECISKPDELEARGLAGRRFVERHCTWTACAQAILSKIETIR